MNRDSILDFWRGVSISMVVVYHFVWVRFPAIKDFAYVPLASGGTRLQHIAQAADKLLVHGSEIAGPLGVKVFFVISGYIITNILLREETRRGSISISNFYARRIFRILPPLLVYLLGLIAFAALGLIAFDTFQVTYALGFLCDTQFVQCTYTVAHTWTLAIEEQYYLVWPLIFFITKKQWRPHVLVGLLISFLVLSALGVLTTQGWIDIPLSFACIAVGALYAHSGKFARYVRGYGVVTIVGIAALSILVYYGLPAAYEMVHQIYRLIQPFTIVVAIDATYLFVRFTRSTLFWGITQIGLISYSLYLWQAVFLSAPEAYLKHSFLEMPLWMFVMAIISYVCIEGPIVRWARARTHRDPGPGI